MCVYIYINQILFTVFTDAFPIEACIATISFSGRVTDYQRATRRILSDVKKNWVLIQSWEISAGQLVFDIPVTSQVEDAIGTVSIQTGWIPNLRWMATSHHEFRRFGTKTMREIWLVVGTKTKNLSDIAQGPRFFMASSGESPGFGRATTSMRNVMTFRS